MTGVLSFYPSTSTQTEMTNEQITKIAIKHLLPYDESGELQWWGKEEQLLKFAREIYRKGKYAGYDSGYDDGCYEATGGQ